MGHAASIKPVSTQLDAVRGAQRTVVVVEDDEAVRRAIERLLRCAGFQARMFASAGAFLESDAASSAACLVLDVRLPGQSGFDLQRVLAREGLRRPVVFITGLDDPKARAEAAGVGAAQFLAKPFRGQELLDAIESAIGESGPL